MKFEQIFKGELPKFDVTFGRGKYSKQNQSLTNNNNNMSSMSIGKHSSTGGGNMSPNKSFSKSVSPKMRHSASAKSSLSNTKHQKFKKSSSTSAINGNSKQRKHGTSSNNTSLNTSASTKLSSKIKKKYSKQKTINEKHAKNMLIASKKYDEELLMVAERELKRQEAEKYMDRKGKI